MPTDDQQILVAGTAAAPAFYKIPGNGQIRPKAINAVFDGSGASGDFLPTLEIVSDGGIVVARVPAATVTQGNAAEVTWAPFLEQPAAATAVQAPVFARAFRDALGGAGDPAQTVNAGTFVNGSFPHTLTTDSTVMSWRTAVLLNDTVDLLKVGSYLICAPTHWDVSDVNLSTIILNAGQTDLPHTPWVPNTIPSVGDGIGSANSQDFTVAHVVAPPTSIHVVHDNKTAGNRFVQQCYFTLVYWPTL